MSKIIFEEHASARYKGRTEANVVSSDVTLAIAADFTTLGEVLTKRLCDQHDKPIYQIGIHKDYRDPNANLGIDIQAKALVDKLNAEFGTQAIVMNVAGNGLYSLNWGQEDCNRYVTDLLHCVIGDREFKPTIIQIRTGGQTGFDEAGAKAAMRLGIPVRVIAPKGWKFRDADGKDISDEKLFKQRFE